MRVLTELEQNKIKILTKNQVSLALIEPTETGLKKSIMDATGPIRSYLKENQIHDYDFQLQGPEHKVIINANIYSDFNLTNSNASLYRPNKKKGDVLTITSLNQALFCTAINLKLTQDRKRKFKTQTPSFLRQEESRWLHPEKMVAIVICETPSALLYFVAAEQGFPFS